MFRKAFAAPLAALVLTAAAPAAPNLAMAGNQDQASGGSSQAKSGNKERARKICKRFDSTGTRMDSKTLCLTPAEWRRFEETQED